MLTRTRSDWDPDKKVVMRYELGPALDVTGADVLYD